MKKIHFLSVMTLIIIFVFCVCACDKTSEETVSPNEAQTVSAEETGRQVEDLLTSKNMVLFIGDGMGLEHIAAGQLYSDSHYDFTDWNRTTVNTDSLRENGWACHTTDSAASGTALATGVLTYNSYIGKDKDGNDVETILDYAKSLGKSTGIVTSDKMYGATPSAFSAHSLSRSNTDEILNSQIETSNVDLLVACESATCSAKRDLIEQNGYAFCEDISQCETVLEEDRAYCLFDIDGNGSDGNFCKSVEFAIDFLDKDEDGFVLIVEQAYIDKYSHNNDFKNMVLAVNSLNKAVEYVNEYSQTNDTAILITADHETGNLSVSQTDNLQNSVDGTAGKVYYLFESTSHSYSDVGLFVNKDIKFYQYSYYLSSQMIKNSDINRIMKALLR